MVSIRRWLIGLGVGLLAAALVGCLDFDEQTLRFEHDRQNDRLIMVINYLGLHSDKGDVGEAESQLEEAIEDGTVALCDNWPFAFSIRELREELADPEAEDMKNVPEDVRRAGIALVERVRVLNGGFYTDPAGRICGAQVVVIEDAAEAMRLANELVSAAVLAEADEPASEDPDERLLLELALKAAAEGHQWLTLDGHSLLVRVPMPERQFDEARRAFLAEALDPGDRDLQVHLSALQQALANPVYAWHEDGMMKVKVGLVTKPPVFVTKPRQGKYALNLVDHITATYGLHLDANLARYLVEPEAPAETEAERAARIMAPRLTKPERARVLVGRLQAAPSDALRAKVRQEELPEPLPEGAPQPSDDELLRLWQGWLQNQAGVEEGTGQPAAEAESGEQ